MRIAESGSGPVIPLDDRWIRRRVPEDVQKTIRGGIEFERESKWVTFLPHHPLCYADFPDLLKIIQRKDNWEEVFQPVLRNKDKFLVLFKSCEQIRNKTCHCRVITDRDIRELENFESFLCNECGVSPEAVARFFENPNIQPSLVDLQTYLRSALDNIRRYAEIGPAPPKITQQWWFDEAYLGIGTEQITAALQLVEAYRNLPRSRGEGYIIERWVIEHDILRLLVQSASMLEQVLGE